jgi:superfamily II DNA/RNA helicase
MAGKICNISKFASTTDADATKILDNSTKIQYILAFLNKLKEGEKVVIASYNTNEFARYLKIVLDENGISSCLIDGSQSWAHSQ